MKEDIKPLRERQVTSPSMSPHSTHAPTPSPSDGLLRVGQLADQSGKTVRAIRFYEELGLLEPTQRTKGGFRQYESSALIRIHWIDRLQELDFSLREIREFLSTLQAEQRGPAAMFQLRAFYGKKLIETRKMLSRLDSLEGELQESLTYLEGCETCAPVTPRSACRSCGETEHQHTETPALVAAVHDPA
jgi:DNA-binding transcriptional MerR regulator